MTILGRHTISETMNLLKLLEWRIDTLNDIVSNYKRTEPDTLDKDATLIADWNNFLKRWVSAKGSVRAKYTAAMVANPLIGPNVIPDEDNYQALLHASSATYPSYGDKDLTGLQQRIQALHPKKPINFGDPPKDFSLDMDLQAYQTANNAAEAINKAGAAAADTGKSFLADNYGKIILIGGSAIGTAIVLKKLHLL